jgi:hypothetical protein
MPYYSSGRGTTEKGNDYDFAGRTVSHIGGIERVSLASDENAMDQLVGVVCLEFGIVLHRHVFCVTCPRYPNRGLLLAS